MATDLETLYWQGVARSLLFRMAAIGVLSGAVAYIVYRIVVRPHWSMIARAICALSSMLLGYFGALGLDAIGTFGWSLARGGKVLISVAVAVTWTATHLIWLLVGRYRRRKLRG